MSQDFAVSESGRRNGFAFWVTEQRLADWTVRAVAARTGFSVVAVGSVFAAAVSGHRPPWLAWIVAAVPLMGVYLAGRVALYVKSGRPPREPLARWAARVAADTQGAMTVNVSALAESAGVVCLGVLGPWVLMDVPAGFRLVAVAAAAGWFASFVSAVMVDVAWYSPGEMSWPPLEGVRRVAGVLAAALFAAVTLPAPWGARERIFVALMCAALVLVQVRINETDRTLALGAVFAADRDVDGRRTVTTALHTLVGNPLIHLKLQARAAGPEFYDAVRQIEGGYRETLALDQGADINADWPGVLDARLQAIAAHHGINLAFTHPEHPMHMSDRAVARFVLDDLSENAAKADALSVAVALRLDEDMYYAVVADDGSGFKPGTWERRGGGLERLRHLLSQHHGTLQHARQHDRTVVTATWRQTAIDTQERS